MIIVAFSRSKRLVFYKIICPCLLSDKPDAILDDEAIIAISPNGTLGDFWEVLSMIEEQKNIVDGLTEKSCSWRAEVAVLKHVFVGAGRRKDSKGYKKRVIAPRVMDITIACNLNYYSNMA